MEFRNGNSIQEGKNYLPTQKPNYEAVEIKQDDHVSKQHLHY